MGEGTIEKFHSLNNEQTTAVTKELIEKALEDGLFGPTKSLVGDFSNEEKIISTLKSLNLSLMKESDVMTFKTKNGFDYQRFLYYGIVHEKFDQTDLEILKDFVYVQELKSDLKNIFQFFYRELATIHKRINENGVDGVDNTIFSLIGFLCNFTALDFDFRIQNQGYLLSASNYLELIDDKLLESKEKSPATYKGVTIRIFGDNNNALVNGLQKVMQAIDLLPAPYIRQLLRMEIRITDCESPGNLTVLTALEKHLRDPKIKLFHSAAECNVVDGKITLYGLDAQTTTKSVIRCLSHELGHAMDHSMVTKGEFTKSTKLWEKAKEADGNAVTAYGAKYVNEDFAEMCHYYCKALLGMKNMDDLKAKHPNRIRLLEAIFDLICYDKKDPTCLSPDRKIEIMQMFEEENTDVMDVFIDDNGKEDIYAMSVDMRIALAHDMVENKLGKQFTRKLLNNQFLSGFNAEDLKNLYQIFEEAGLVSSTDLFAHIGSYGDSIRAMDDKSVSERLSWMFVFGPQDEECIKTLKKMIVQLPNNMCNFAYQLKYYKDKISPGLYRQLVNLLISDIGTKYQEIKEEKNDR